MSWRYLLALSIQRLAASKSSKFAQSGTRAAEGYSSNNSQLMQ